MKFGPIMDILLIAVILASVIGMTVALVFAEGDSTIAAQSTGACTFSVYTAFAILIARHWR